MAGLRILPSRGVGDSGTSEGLCELAIAMPRTIVSR